MPTAAHRGFLCATLYLLCELVFLDLLKHEGDHVPEDVLAAFETGDGLVY